MQSTLRPLTHWTSGRRLAFNLWLITLPWEITSEKMAECTRKTVFAWLTISKDNCWTLWQAHHLGWWSEYSVYHGLRWLKTCPKEVTRQRLGLPHCWQRCEVRKMPKIDASHANVEERKFCSDCYGQVGVTKWEIQVACPKSNGTCTVLSTVKCFRTG